MTVRLYNTLGREKQPLEPIEEGKVGFYACGPTVYNYAHLGNLRAYVFMDLLSRMLQYAGFDVTLVMNITDVGHLTDDADQGEDKMEKGAAREGKSVWDLAKQYTEAFFADLEALNIKTPDVTPKATDHISEQASLVQAIISNGHAYLTSDGIYFDTSTLDDYGKLVPNFSAKNLSAGERVDMKEKKSPTDFALWKVSPEGESRAMEWETTFNLSESMRVDAAKHAAENEHIAASDGGEAVTITGFPGWHAECTAMAVKYLGERFDIHTGGIDHIPVHHTNEIAQAQGAYGHDHVDYWLHNEFLLTDKEKMAKSKGDFLRLQTVLDEGYSALDYRYLCLTAHYRKPLTFTWDALESAARARKKLTDKVIALKEGAERVNDLSDERLELQSRFYERVTDDLDTPGALAIVHETLKSDLSAGEKLSLILDWDSVLGLRLAEAHKPDVAVPEDVQELVEEREKAREEKDFERADKLRSEIEAKGWKVSDTDDGPVLEPA